jgi:hypothetical protein
VPLVVGIKGNNGIVDVYGLGAFGKGNYYVLCRLVYELLCGCRGKIGNEILTGVEQSKKNETDSYFLHDRNSLVICLALFESLV